MIESVRNGVAEITLSDGRVVRAALRPKGLKSEPKDPSRITMDYEIVAEVVKAPEVAVLHAQHQTLQ